MRGAACGRGLLLVLGIGLLAWAAEGPAQTAKVVPRLEAVAETKLLMEGLAQSNFRGLDRLLKDKLEFASDSPYVVHAPLWEKWAWKDFANRYVNVGESLRRAIHANPHMRVYVASGFYDLGTPHAAGDFTVTHLGLRESLRKNVAVSYFEAGHMMYIHRPSLARMAKEIKAFVTAA